jgi:peptidoglycan/xylan/chitin deacetylase (PgdA/CDA1 family)
MALETMLARALLSTRAPAGKGGRLSTLIFHRVLPAPDPLLPGELDQAGFARLMGWVAGAFNVLPLDEAVARLKSDRLPARAAAITFDDGYADNFSMALPVLQHFRLPATFFIATGFLDGGRMWNDTVIESVRSAQATALTLPALGVERLPLESVAQRIAAIECLLGKVKHLPAAERAEAVARIAQACGGHLPDTLMMRSEQVRGLHTQGMEIGAHTVTHPILALADDASAEREMADSRDRLEHITGSRVRFFAYPNGKAGADYRGRDVALAARLGFEAALTTDWGVAGAATDLFRLPRFTPWDRSQGRFCLRMWMNLGRIVNGAPGLAGMRAAAQGAAG